MFAGKLRHRLTLQKLTEVQAAGSGEVADAWLDESTYWAEVVPLAGQELFDARQVQPEVTHRITVRYGVPVSAEKRWRWGSRTFGILAVLNENERNRELQVACKELI